MNFFMKNIINRLKNETNNNDKIIYRKKKILYKEMYIIFNETLVDSDNISDFVVRSLNRIRIPTYNNIINRINVFKYKELNNYQDFVYYLNSGFTIILYSKDKYIALETRRNLSRSVGTPITENTPRGALDSFTENIEMNIGLLKRRIKSNDLWFKSYKLGKYTETSVNLGYMNSIVNPKLVEKVDKLLKGIKIDGVISSGSIRNLIEKENKNLFPDIMSVEKPYTVIKYLLQGHVVIMLDNDPFALILPISLNDFFKSEEDDYNKNRNVIVTRVVRYVSFIISLLTPGVYIALTTYNQEVIPIELLTSIASQQEAVPFSTFTECFLMICAFEILRESDLKLPSFANSALSIVGALILGEAAVSAGIVSPIMIIVVAITAISSLAFTEPEFINALRVYRFLFMVGAAILGIYGVLWAFIYLLIKLASHESFSLPYLTPYAPVIGSGLQDSVYRAPVIKSKERNKLLTNNRTRNVSEEPYE